MLTVDYHRLGLQAGERVLDMGTGAGRHAFECYRRGARVVALDPDPDELSEVRSLLSAMAESGEGPITGLGATVRGDGTNLGFANDAFDRIIASEVMEHIADAPRAAAELARVLRPGGTLAVTVPAWFPEQVCWALSADYHAPRAAGGHVRIFTEARLRRLLADAGLVPGEAHHAHALHSPYWWLRCAVGPDRHDHPAVTAYRRVLEWDIAEAPPLTRWTERLLNPLLGKSLVVYATRPSGTDRRPGPAERLEQRPLTGTSA